MFYWIILFLILTPFIAFANIKWKSIDGSTGIASCSRQNKKCIESGKRIIDGIKIYKSCWKYSYEKRCNYPSINDCRKIKHCYEIGIKECLLWDEFGNCVNQKKEFSCKNRIFAHIKRDIVKIKNSSSKALEIICKGIPCIDGNCIDKSYLMDSDILNSASQLYILSNMKEEGNIGANIFPGNHEYCKKKPVGYLSCCKVKGWGKELGAKCSPDELELQKKREKNLCIYIGKSTSGTSPFHVNKHHFCCFGNIFSKVFQIQARKQIGINFGNSDNPHCNGFTIEQITSLNFEKMDFSEFASEIKKNMKFPNIKDVEERIVNNINHIDKESGLLNE